VVRPFYVYARADNLPLFLVQPKSPPIGLSKATKLKNVVFHLLSQSVEWVTAILKTIPKHRDLPEVSIHLPFNVVTTGDGGNAIEVIGETNLGEWLDLDRLLVQFWESSSIRPRVVRPMRMGRVRSTMYCVGYQSLLPEITKRGIIDLVGDR
jgi:hypothetical protein